MSNKKTFATNDCPHMLNWVIPHQVAVGDMDAAKMGPLLKKNNIHTIITVRGRLSQPPEYYKKHGIAVLHIPISDHELTNIGKYFPLVYNFIEQSLQNKKAVLVHCAAGISRSTTLATSYLMRKYKLSATNALKVIKKHRTCANPNSGFIRQLHDYEHVLKNHNLM